MGSTEDLEGVASGCQAETQSVQQRYHAREGSDAGRGSTLGAPSCIAQVRHFDQPDANILKGKVFSGNHLRRRKRAREAVDNLTSCADSWEARGSNQWC